MTLPAAASHSAVLVDTEACIICLSCVSLCPSSALRDNVELSQLLFQQDACSQCRLRANICPEKAISFEPRIHLGDDALSEVVLCEEEPCTCIECGAQFGVQSTVDKIPEKVLGKHKCLQPVTRPR